MTEANQSQDLGKKITVLKSIFLYKVNVAVAGFLLFVNVQAFVRTLLFEAASQMQIGVGIGLIAASLGYSVLAINGYLSKIILHEKGFVIKNFFGERIVADDDIANVFFHRVNLQKLIMRIALKSHKSITLRSNKYNSPDFPFLVEYLAKFKKEITPQE